jgi:hypothetical protein
LFEVDKLKVFVSIDGVDWHDEHGKDAIDAGALLTGYLKHSKSIKPNPGALDIISVTERVRVKCSTALRMHDGNYLPVPHVVGGYHYPLVFNNACCSWQELASKFTYGGASVYIGTSTDISNFIAIPIAFRFTCAVVSGKAAGTALFNAQREFVEQLGYTPYLLHGYLFSHYKRPDLNTRHQEIAGCLIHVMQQYESRPGEHTHAAANFLRGELDHLRR